jgi:large subunit ribosomal protein L15
VRVGFQGGQLRLIKSLPMLRGFTPRSQTRYQEVNLDRLSRLSQGTEATPETMAEAGLIDSAERPVKVLGRGEIAGPMTVSAHRFSASARRKIETAGGTVRQVE